jgi:hypothetical protein
MDEVAKLYEEMIVSSLIEMTHRIDRNVSYFGSGLGDIYNKAIRSYSNIDKMDNGYILHSSKDRMKYVTSIDGENAVHASVFAAKQPNTNVPFYHHVQQIVDQHKTNAPKGIARRVMFNHIYHHKVPLVSDEEQTDAGHNLWKKFAKEALDTGHHVYFLDAGKLHMTSKDNIDDHLSKYFDSGIDKRMVVSKEPLNGFN